MYEKLPFSITRIDTGLNGSGQAACYLLESGGEAAVIETGVNTTTDRILALLEQREIPRGKVRYVIPTHIHLDHAGGAGSLMASLPRAQLAIHPRGVRHMIDPSRLTSGAASVYGEEVFKSTYGEIIPVPDTRIISVEDNAILTIGSRSLLFRHTPGHAEHHLCIWDETSSGWFSGDTFGNGYIKLASAAGPFLFPATAPVQFDPPKLLDSIELMMGYAPKRLYLTHFGVIEITPKISEMLCQQIRDYVSLIESLDIEEATVMRIERMLTEYTIDKLSEHGCELNLSTQLDTIAIDMKVNSQGLVDWLSKNNGKKGNADPSA